MKKNDWKRIAKKGLIAALFSLSLITSNNANAELKNDVVITNNQTNMLYSDNQKSFVLGIVRDKVALNRIYSTPFYSLVEIDNQYFYVKNDDISYLTNADGNHYGFQEYFDVVKVTNNLNLRSQPVTDKNNVIDVLKNGDDAIVIGKADDNWYLVKYSGKIGYIKSDYTISLYDIINANISDSDIEKGNIRIYGIGYVKNDMVPLYKDKNLTISNPNQLYMNQYELVNIIGQDESGKNYLVYFDSVVGYINGDDVQITNYPFVSVDLGEQKLQYFYNGDVIIDANITSGKDETPTRTGKYKVQHKDTFHYFEEFDCTAQYFIQYDGNYAIHDLKQRIEYGSDKYHKSGSHGCVRMSLDDAQELYGYVNKDNYVVISR